MKIETYEIEENNSSDAAIMAADSEAIELIQKLGLEGQRELVDMSTGTRFQYPRMTSLQSVVLRACFPSVVRLDLFKHEIIPLRVLQVAAFCRDFQQTRYLEVWHTGIPKQDPVLVGKANERSSETYLLARWGDALPTFEELTTKARELLKVRYAAKFRSMKARLAELEGDIDSAVEEALSTGTEPSFWIHA